MSLLEEHEEEAEKLTLHRIGWLQDLKIFLIAMLFVPAGWCSVGGRVGSYALATTPYVPCERYVTFWKCKGTANSSRSTSAPCKSRCVTMVEVRGCCEVIGCVSEPSGG